MLKQLVSYMMPVLNTFCEKYDYIVPSIDTLIDLPISIIVGEEIDCLYAALELFAPYGLEVMRTVAADNVHANHALYTPMADDTIMVFNPTYDVFPVCLIHEFSHYIQHSNGNWKDRDLLEEQAESIEDMFYDYYNNEDMDIPRRAMLDLSQSLLEGGDTDGR